MADHAHSRARGRGESHDLADANNDEPRPPTTPKRPRPYCAFMRKFNTGKQKCTEMIKYTYNVFPRSIWLPLKAILARLP